MPEHVGLEGKYILQLQVSREEADDSISLMAWPNNPPEWASDLEISGSLEIEEARAAGMTLRRAYKFPASVLAVFGPFRVEIENSYNTLSVAKARVRVGDDDG